MIIAKLLRNTVSNFGMKLFTIILTLVASPVLISTIGAENYGILLFLGTVNGFFDILGLGVPSGTVKFIAQHSEDEDRTKLYKIIDTSLGFFLAVGGAVCLGLLAFSWLGGVDLFRVPTDELMTVRTMLTISAVLALFSWPATVLMSVLDGLQEHHHKNVVTGTTSLLSLGGATLVALFTHDVFLVFLTQQVCSVLRWLLLARGVRIYLPDWRPRPLEFDSAAFKAVFGLSVWMLLIQVAGLLNYKVDEFILGAALPFAMIAVYDTLVRPFRFVQQGSGLFNSAIVPAVSAFEAREGRGNLNVFTDHGVRYNNLFVAPMALTATLFCAPFLRLWQPALFAQTSIEEYIWVAQLACAFQLLWQSNSTLNRVFYGTGEVERIAIIGFLTAALNAGISVVLVGELGVAGVVMGTVVVGLFAVPAQYIFLFPLLELRRGRHLFKNVLRSQLPAVVVFAALVPFWDNIQAIDSWVVLVAGLLAVLLVMWTLGWFWGVEPEHKRWVGAKIQARRAAMKGGS